MKRFTIKTLLATAGLISFIVVADGPALESLSIKGDLAVCTLTGAKSNCTISQTINAIGEVPVRLLPENVKDFGKITKNTDITITAPSANQQSWFKYEPSQGDLKGTKINIGVVNVPQGSRSRLAMAGKTVYTVHRLLDNEKGQLLSRIEARNDARELPFIIHPDGTLEAYNAKTKQTVELEAGKQGLQTASE